MATLRVLLFSTIMYVAYPADATPVSSRVIRSYGTDKCFDDLLKCNKILPAHGSLPGLKNPSSQPWYHCECTNKLNKCIRDDLGPLDPDNDDPAYAQYFRVTSSGICYREQGNSIGPGPEYEKVQAPLNDSDIPIYW